MVGAAAPLVLVEHHRVAAVAADRWAARAFVLPALRALRPPSLYRAFRWHMSRICLFCGFPRGRLYDGLHPRCRDQLQATAGVTTTEVLFRRWSHRAIAAAWRTTERQIRRIEQTARIKVLAGHYGWKLCGSCQGRGTVGDNARLVCRACRGKRFFMKDGNTWRKGS